MFYKTFCGLSQNARPWGVLRLKANNFLKSAKLFHSLPQFGTQRTYLCLVNNDERIRKMRRLEVKTKTKDDVKEVKKNGRLTLLGAIEQIVELSEGSNLSDEFYAQAKRYINYVCRKLSVNKVQAVLLSLFIDNCNDYRIDLKQLSSHLNCRMVSIIRYGAEIDYLVKRKLIRCRRDRDSESYRVPPEVVNAFKRNEAYVPVEPKNLTCDGLFGELEELFNNREREEISYDDLVNELVTLFENNCHLEFVKQLRRYGLIGNDDIKPVGLLFVCMANIFVNEDDDDIRPHQFEDIFRTKSTARHLKSELSHGDSELQKEGLIEFACENGFADRNAYRLTAKAKREVLAELNITLTKAANAKELIRHGDISEKRLFYNERESGQIRRLAELLDEAHYAEVCDRLKAAGMRTGFACLFYGAPGTGKTETALQLARITGRNIMQVNFAEIKSCWVGESEKNVKELFDRYRALVGDSAKAPILLFNEADALIGRRKQGAEQAVDKMENTLQNIILQEMEKLDGILIATTNLTQNMDKAFERRFLYKIEFGKPCAEAKRAIWQAMIPGLNATDVAELAANYDFSGGQIENIARKHTVETILYGDTSNCMESLKKLCDEELITKQETKRKIGF